MLILISFINALGNNLYETEREHTVILKSLTHTYVVVIVTLKVFCAHDLTVAVGISTDRITAIVS